MAQLNLAIAFDQNYIAPFYALLTSIFNNNKNNATHIHLIVTGLSDSEKKAISTYASAHDCSIHYYNIDTSKLSNFVLNNNWTAAVYYRLFFPLLVPESITRLLYLDTDTLVINNLQELFNQDLNGHPVGAVYDNYVKNAPQLGIFNEEEYLNSGVLLIDIAKWKQQKISEKAFQFLQEFPQKIKFVDQDALNYVLVDNWKKLDKKYNFMYSYIPEQSTSQTLQNYLEEVVVLHFTLQRPWHMLCRNRYRELYFLYLEKSPLKSTKKIADFKWNKLFLLFKIRIEEFYYDSQNFQRLWRSIKQNDNKH